MLLLLAATVAEKLKRHRHEFLTKRFAFACESLPKDPVNATLHEIEVSHVVAVVGGLDPFRHADAGLTVKHSTQTTHVRNVGKGNRFVVFQLEHCDQLRLGRGDSKRNVDGLSVGSGKKHHGGFEDQTKVIAQSFVVEISGYLSSVSVDDESDHTRQMSSDFDNLLDQTVARVNSVLRMSHEKFHERLRQVPDLPDRIHGIACSLRSIADKLPMEYEVEMEGSVVTLRVCKENLKDAIKKAFDLCVEFHMEFVEEYKVKVSLR